jgi:uncharacterized protein
MKRGVLLDTGPLVAFVNHRDAFHQWVLEQIRDIQYPMITCEPVLTEACFLLQYSVGRQSAIFDMVSRDLLVVPLHVTEEVAQISQLMRKYADVPMSLADACLVRLAEQYPQSIVFTLDSDFRIYRKHGRQKIPCILPE